MNLKHRNEAVKRLGMIVEGTQDKSFNYSLGVCNNIPTPKYPALLNDIYNDFLTSKNISRWDFAMSATIYEFQNSLFSNLQRELAVYILTRIDEVYV